MSRNLSAIPGIPYTRYVTTNSKTTKNNTQVGLAGKTPSSRRFLLRKTKMADDNIIFYIKTFTTNGHEFSFIIVITITIYTGKLYLYSVILCSVLFRSVNRGSDF